MTISGSGTITGLSAGGLPSATITQANVATPLAGTGPAFSAYNNATQSVTGNVATKILFQTEEYDTNNNFASSIFTPTVAGYYQINAAVESNAVAGTYFLALLYKNGSLAKAGPIYTPTVAAGPRANVNSLIYCNGSTDYIEIYAQGQNNFTVQSATGTAGTYFNGALVRAA
jgi:hypothetical protein